MILKFSLLSNNRTKLIGSIENHILIWFENLSKIDKNWKTRFFFFFWFFDRHVLVVKINILKGLNE